jgi:hypothetical protein
MYTVAVSCSCIHKYERVVPEMNIFKINLDVLSQLA